MMFVMYILLVLKTAQALQGIQVSCGQLHIEGYSSCKIEHDNHVSTYTGPAKEVLIGPFFGLISYNCDQMAGYLMSEIDCEKCNFECNQEEQPVYSCERDTAQIWIGVFFGGIVSILIVGFLWNRLSLSSTKCLRINCENRSENSVNEVFSDGKMKENKDFCNAENRTHQKTFASLMAALLFFKTAETCDVLVVMGVNNNEIAFAQGSDGGTHFGFFTVRHGNMICIEDHTGERVSIQISEVAWRYKYELAYYTSDFAYTSVFTSKCCVFIADSDNRCGGDLQCESDLLDDLKKKTNITNVQNVQNSCYMRRINAYIDSWNYAMCAHVEQFARKGELYSVFERKPSQAPAETITLIVRSRNVSQVIKIQSFDPTHELDLTKFKLQGVDKIPLTVVEGKMNTAHSSVALLQYDNQFYHTSGFEDFKINASNPDEILKQVNGSTKCESTGECDCTCHFEVPESQLSKFVSEKHNYRQARNIAVRRNGSSVIIDSFETAENENQWELKMRLGSLTSHHFNLMKGICDVTVLGNFGCSSCNESAYVVLETKNIQNEGFMPFYSNCSFDRNSINCEDGPTKLILRSNQDTCYMKLLTTNKTHVVHLNYSTFGHQTKIKHQVNTTEACTGYSEAIQAFFATLFIFLVISLLAKIIFIFSNRRNSSLNNANKEEDLLEL